MFRVPFLFCTVVLVEHCLVAESTEKLTNFAPFASVKCEGTYQHHLQGICTDNRDSIFWSFTTTLVKTDRNGKVIKKIAVGNHHGDLCFHEGKLYIAVNFGPFNDPAGKADSWVYVYDAKDLARLSRHKTPQVIYGAGGIGYRKGRFYVVGGLPEGVGENYVYEYDSKFRFIKKHTVKSRHTHLGIQTATFVGGQWYFGCYGDPKILLRTDTEFRVVGRSDFDCSLGVVGVAKGKFLVGAGKCSKDKGCTGQVLRADADVKSGLVRSRK